MLPDQVNLLFLQKLSKVQTEKSRIIITIPYTILKIDHCQNLQHIWISSLGLFTIGLANVWDIPLV